LNPGIDTHPFMDTRSVCHYIKSPSVCHYIKSPSNLELNKKSTSKKIFFYEDHADHGQHTSRETKLQEKQVVFSTKWSSWREGCPHVIPLTTMKQLMFLSTVGISLVIATWQASPWINTVGVIPAGIDIPSSFPFLIP